MLQRFGILGFGLLGLLVLAGFFSLVMMPNKEEAYYTPGRIPTREDCFYEKLAVFKNVNRQIIFQVASDCELEVQSLEGHEQMRQEWIERQAEKARQRAAEKVVAEPAPPTEQPQELDRVRRVWR